LAQASFWAFRLVPYDPPTGRMRRAALLLCCWHLSLRAAALRRASGPEPADVEPIPLSLNRAENGACSLPHVGLTRSESFNPTWWQERSPRRGHVGTESEDCKLFRGHGRKCLLEAPEHTLVRRWIKRGDVVMEFGARFGTTSCEIAKAIGNSGALVSVEPDPSVWGALDTNLLENNCHARVVQGALSSRPVFIPKGTSYATKAGCSGDIKVPNYSLEEVEQALGKKVDTLLIDCEGCAESMMDQLHPSIKTQVRTIILEADGFVSYHKLLDDLKADGFETVDELNDCDKNATGAPPEVWCWQKIKHYVLQRKGR